VTSVSATRAIRSRTSRIFSLVPTVRRSLAEVALGDPAALSPGAPAALSPLEDSPPRVRSWSRPFRSHVR
jgi:hypothetical protein